jgi:phosphoglycerate kinase
MEEKLSIRDLKLENKTVLMRVDFNVPLSKEGKIEDDTRIVKSLESINYVLKKGASLVLMSHLGRPKGQMDLSLSLKVIKERLSQLLKKEVRFASDCISKDTLLLKKELNPGEVLLLENLRFYSEEEKPTKELSFAKKLAEECDIYINDAFGCAHRPHSSMVGITSFFKNTSAMGFLIEKEVQFLKNKLLHPRRPLAALIGGAKLSSKLKLLKSLIDHVDLLLIGGAMAHPFFLEKGYAIGDSLVEEALEDEVKGVIQRCHERKIKLILPIDVITANAVEEGAQVQQIKIDQGVAKGSQIVDVGPESISLFKESLKDAQTIFFNGSLGIVEISAFSQGTDEIAHTLAASNATTIIGGGDSVAAIKKLHLEDLINHISTGGGASIEFVESGSLVGIEALSAKKN